MVAEPEGRARVASEINRAVPVAAPGEFAPLVLAPRGEARAPGRLDVWPPVVLAPMAGVTNYAFRSLCREHGAGLYVSEMITARGFLAGNALTTLLASSSRDEVPRSVQVYGSDPVDLGEMVKRLVAEGVDHVDINMGCPVPKVTRAGGGSAIPAKPRLLARLVRAMVQSAGDVPVTVKMRKGIDETLPTYLAAGRAAAAEGAAAVGLHARTAAQLYSGEADWSAIGELAADLPVPVLGNGDVWECFDALRMMRETGCAGVIVGRGCLGRPWLFRELAQVFAGIEPDPPPRFGEVARVMHDHAARLVRLFGERMGMLQFRKWTSWYTKGYRDSARVRGDLMQLERLADLGPLLARLHPSAEFPAHALRVNRAKGNRTQCVRLPAGYLDELDDDRPPRGPHTAEEIAAWESALNGG